jgi:hypothetical protein
VQLHAVLPPGSRFELVALFTNTASIGERNECDEAFLTYWKRDLEPAKSELRPLQFQGIGVTSSFILHTSNARLCYGLSVPLCTRADCAKRKPTKDGDEIFGEVVLHYAAGLGCSEIEIFPHIAQKREVSQLGFDALIQLTGVGIEASLENLKEFSKAGVL